MQRSDWLAQTKLQPPLLHADVIERDRLLEALRTAVTTRPVTLVSAPAGYGKTTLLASLPQLLPELPIAWLSLDGEENDPARFFGALIASLQRLHPEIGADAKQHVASDPRRVMTVLINQILEHVDGPLAVVLDDLHLITEPRVHTALDFLIERLPPQMRLVIATRHDPPLALARLIARRQVAELRRPQLTFTPTEAERLLNDTFGLHLAPTALAALNDRTEGWAAGLCLLASSLERITTDAGRTALLDGLAHTDTYVFDFLAAEVLSSQEPEVRQFLLQTSILAELTPALCEAVTGSADAGRLLADLYRRNLFLVASEGGAFRYHALFAEFLRRQLEQEQPQLPAELHRRAASAQPAATQAISHLLAAGLHAEAAERIEQVGGQLLQSGLTATLAAWGRQIPPDVRMRSPQLCLTLSKAAIVLSDFRGAYDLANEALEATAPDDLPRQVIALNAMASVGMLMGDADACRRALARFGALRALADPLRARALSLQAYVHGADRRWADAGAVSAEALSLVHELGDLSAALDVAHRFGPWVATLPGGLPALEHFAQWAVSQTREDAAALRMVAADRMAWTELLRGRLVSAASAAQTALAIKERINGYTWLGTVSLAALTTIALLKGDKTAAIDRTQDLVRSAELLAADQSQIWLYVAARTSWMVGRPDEARDLLFRMANAPHARGFSPGPALQDRLRGLLALTAHHPAEAERAFRGAVQGEADFPMAVLPGSARVLLVKALWEQHREVEAMRELRALLDACETQELPGLVLQEAPLILPALQQAANTGNRLAASLLGMLEVPSSPPAQALPDPLTERELKVLRLLAGGATNREIASALIVGDETVKTHVARILRKLDVPSRNEAAARARELGLI